MNYFFIMEVFNPTWPSCHGGSVVILLDKIILLNDSNVTIQTTILTHSL